MAADGPRLSIGEVQSTEETCDRFADEFAEVGIHMPDLVQTVVAGLAEPNQRIAQGVGQRPGLVREQSGGVVVDVDQGQVEAVDAGAGNCADV